jgi:dihydroorotate dehydrogenase electron transfer subunit
MVGGGYGVPPLVFLADRIKQANPAALVLFLVGARSRELVMCEAHLQEHGVETRITTEDGSYGEIGRVTDLLDEILVGHKANIKVYTCGPTGMMRTVAEKCLAAKVQCQVSLEVPMPCGIGVCMGCVVDTVDSRRVRACRSGPVFEASELVF